MTPPPTPSSSEVAFHIEAGPEGDCLHMSGDWRLGRLPRIDAALAESRQALAGVRVVDGSRLEALDTAGAMLFCQRLKEAGLDPTQLHWQQFPQRHQDMLALVRSRMQDTPRLPTERSSLIHQLGVWGARGLAHGRDYLVFLGHVGEALADWLRRPASFRHREFFVQLEAVGVGALPIVAMMTFLIGVVFTYLLGIQIEKFGANIFIVDGVGLAVARELAPLLTALLVAGRSGAAFTAQIGAMKVTEEIDAIRTLGLSPIQVLVLPRLLAIMITLPLLTFVANISGLLGAALVAEVQLDITWYTFFSRLQDVLPLYTVWLGLAKAPVFAAAIAIIACLNGFNVSRDARSVGEHTTRTVVWCLVSVILIDALFAIAFPKISA